jgi:hypothetical protein
MDIEATRNEWKNEDVGLAAFVDKMTQGMIDQNAAPAACMVVDKVFRSYLEWLVRAKKLDVHPLLARNSMVHLLTIVILETALRINTRDDEGKQVSIEEWLGELLMDIRDELIQDVRHLSQQSETVGNA